jgi:hypothetical protein
MATNPLFYHVMSAVYLPMRRERHFWAKFFDFSTKKSPNIVKFSESGHLNNPAELELTLD